MYDADAIVIGSGHNGLAAALVLARRGWKVLVLERDATPGGAARTEEVTLPGFHHDLFATNVGLFMGSPIYREFHEELHTHGFTPVVADRPFASAFPDDDALRVSTDAAQTRAEVARYSEDDALAWDALLARFGRAASRLLPFLQLPMPSYAALRQIYRLYRHLGRREFLELGQLMLSSPRSFTEATFASPKVRSLFIPWGFHLDYGPDVAGGSLFPFLEVCLDHQLGMVLSKGGVGHLIGALVKTLEAYGGLLVTGREVTKVLVAGGRAHGVRTADGQTLTARRAVIANVTPTALASCLVGPGDLPASYIEKVRRYRYGPGTMMIHLALSSPMTWRAGDDLASFSYVHLAPYVEDVAQAYTESVNGFLPRSPLLVVGQQSAFDPTRAPEGRHTLWIQVRAVPGDVKGDATGEISAREWGAIKETYADRVLAKIGAYATGLESKILARTVLSPADLEARNPNLVGGDSVAGSHHLDQFFLFRPVPGWSRYRTPVQNLYMVGASTWPGGGLNATSGYLLAQDLLAGRH